MSDVPGVNSSNPLAALQGAGRTIRITPTPPTPPTPPSAAQVRPADARPTDAISFSKAARALSKAPAAGPAQATYGLAGLQASTPAAVHREMGKLVAARIDARMDYVSGQAPARPGSLPFYTNPALANSAATSSSVARLGGSIDTTG